MLYEVMSSYRAALLAHRETLNLLNVYPVPDGDTGSNMTATLESVMAELDDLKKGSGLSVVAEAIAHGSLMGARGNSGVILSQILRALATSTATASFDPNGRWLADGLVAASVAAYEAVGTPVEGTILTVVREASEAAVQTATGSSGLLAVAEAAREAAGRSLDRTPELLPVLAEAGVVDAGGYGFLLFLDAVLTVVDGRALPEAPDPGSVPRSADNHHVSTADTTTRYEVMYFLDADDDLILDFRTTWDSLGDSVVVVGGEGLWNCHVHTDDIGSAIEAGIAVGRPHGIRVTDLLEEVAEQDWVREKLDHKLRSWSDSAQCAVVSVANGNGVREIFDSLGVGCVVDGGQSMNPSTKELLEAVEGIPTSEILILPNNPNVIPVAEQVDSQTTKTVRVLPTRNVTEGFASLLEYDPESPIDENLARMGNSLESITSGEVTVAVRDAPSDVGPIVEGNYLGLSDGRVKVVAESLAGATVALLDCLLGVEHELVTLIRGADADDSTTDTVVAWLRAEHPSVDVELHDGDQPLYPFYLGIE